MGTLHRLTAHDIHMSHGKKCRGPLLSIESWLVHRDLYNSLSLVYLSSLYSWVIYNPPYTPNNHVTRGHFFITHIYIYIICIICIYIYIPLTTYIPFTVILAFLSRQVVCHLFFTQQDPSAGFPPCDWLMAQVLSALRIKVGSDLDGEAAPQNSEFNGIRLMSRWKLGSMVRINGLFHLLINGVFLGVITPLILTIY